MTIFWLLIALVIVAAEAKVTLPPGKVVPAIYAFGDSIVDQGMNNYIPTIIKGNFPPYGVDFPGGVSTGRFSNGKTPCDLISEELGIKELVPPYLEPNLTPQDLRTGVSFASGAAGYDPETSILTSVVPMTEQLRYFEECVGKIKGAFGESEAKFITDNAIYLVVAGSDDFANTYFTIGLRRLHFDINAYADLVVKGASDFIQELYNKGARRMGIFSLAPIGCIPSQRTLGGGLSRNCSEKYNDAAKLANAKLYARIQSLSKSLPNSKLVYIDIFTPLLKLILNPHQYGFEVSDRGCCGTGKIEVSILCNKFSKTCADHDKYIFWDSYHPTERGYRVLVNLVLKKYMSQFY